MSTTELPPSAPHRSGQPRSSGLLYLWFLIPGLGFLATAVAIALWVLEKYVIFAHIAAELGVGLVAIALIDFLWVRLGGTPLEQQVSEFSSANDRALASLQTATAALQHFQEFSIGNLEKKVSSVTAAFGDLQELGISRLYGERIKNREERRASWRRRLLHAKEVDLMGLTLWEEWFDHEELRGAITDITRNGGRVRIVVLPKDECNEHSSKHLRMQQPGEALLPALLPALLSSTYSQIDQLLAAAPADRKDAIQVRVAQKCIIYALVVRIDNYALVAPYAASAVGDKSFAFEVEGAEKPIFILYRDEFESVFGNSTPYQPPAEDDE